MRPLIFSTFLRSNRVIHGVLITSLLCIVSSSLLLAQSVNVRNGFIPDSVVVGDKAAFYLTATYPKTLNIIFPDSTYSFAPFEFVSKRYFTTKTKDSLSYDSAVYWLSTFEVDPIQYLQLPVFVVHAQDCTTVASLRDSVLLKELVIQTLPDTLQAQNLPLKTNTEYEPVHWLLNYPLLLIAVGVLLVALIVGWLVLGKRIRKYYRAKRLTKQHIQFLEAYNVQLQQLQQKFSPVLAERSLSHWKGYMEALEANPYTKLTAKEIATLIKNKALGEQLQEINAAVYGHNIEVIEPLIFLREHAVKIFNEKLVQVKHG
jgi:hypothetical protein